MVEQTIKMPVIWDALSSIVTIVVMWNMTQTDS